MQTPGPSAEQRRSVAVVLAAVLILAPIAGAGAAAADDGWPDGPERIFYSDDPETGNVTGNGSDVSSLAEILDLHYRTTRPEFTANGSTLQEYRRSQLRSVDRDRDTSKFLPHSELEDSGAIQDAHVTLLGTVGGAEPVVPASATDDSDVDAYIPAEGQVLNFLDYRIEESNLPDDEVDVTEITVDNESVQKRVVTEYEIDPAATGAEARTVTVDGDEVGADTGDPEARMINYTGADGDGVVTLRIEATIVVAGTKTTTTFVDGNQTEQTSDRMEFDTMEVSDTIRVRVVDDQALSISQRAVVFEGPKPAIVSLRFDGPESLAQRQLWSLLRFGDGVISNNWGVYSTTQYHHGYVADGDGEEEFAFPHVLAVKFTSTGDRPSGGALPAAAANGARVEAVLQENMTDDRPPVGEDINFTTKAPTTVYWMHVGGVQESISSAVDLFGRSVTVEDEQQLTVHEAELSVEFFDENRTRVRLYDPDTGEGISDRVLRLDGAEPNQVRTNETGVATFNRTDQFVRVRFEGDAWREDFRQEETSGRYYQPETVEETTVPVSALVGSFVDLLWRLLIASPFIAGLYILRSRNKDL